MKRFENNRLIDTTERLPIQEFADASTNACGAVLCAATTEIDGRTRSRLLTSKTRVAPLRMITVP